MLCLRARDISVTSIAPFVVLLGWVSSTTAGHTKRTTMNTIVMIGYAVGNAAGPQYWKAKYQKEASKEQKAAFEKSSAAHKH